LNRKESGVFQLPEGPFELTQGNLVIGKDSTEVWQLVTTQEADWLRQVRAVSAGLFGDVATVHVGIKTTADEVFIRDDWDELPADMKPEPDLLRPLLRHEDATCWAIARDTKTRYRVLYPHEVVEGRRRPVDLRCYPHARAYLERHRDRLVKRHYVIEAGRQWYEIWVPQDPAGWQAPKIVFPDISPQPRFYLDRAGRVVDGDCYWITLHPGQPEELLCLLLAVANSRLMSRYHDLAFNNRLYSERRRYIAQYVAKYPFPPPDTLASRKLITTVRGVVEERERGGTDGRATATENLIGALVYQAFGLHDGE
jgi:adenine-specific DNA-methyltransferase